MSVALFPGTERDFDLAIDEIFSLAICAFDDALAPFVNAFLLAPAVDAANVALATALHEAQKGTGTTINKGLDGDGQGSDAADGRVCTPINSKEDGYHHHFAVQIASLNLHLSVHHRIVN